MTSLLLLILAGQVVYVGSINPAHLPLARLFLEAGKAVLCEKPLAINLRETRQLVQLARDRGVFLMEAIWSRCIPAYKVMFPTCNWDEAVEQILHFTLFVPGSKGCH